MEPTTAAIKQNDNQYPNAEKDKAPIINCHTHIFTGDHVPPWLAKTFLVWPLYYLIPLGAIVKLFRWWYNKGPYRWQFKPWYKAIARNLIAIKVWLNKSFILTGIKWAVGLFLTEHAFFIIYNWLGKIFSPGTGTWIKWIDRSQAWLYQHQLLLPLHIFWQVMIVLLVLLFIPSGRNLIVFVTNKLWHYMSKLPEKQTKELIKRYLNIGRFAFHHEQSRIFGQLHSQYPQDTGFVILPMDMEYMGAGNLKPAHRYRQQMKELAAIKKNHPAIFYPFVFADPRRFVAPEKEKNHQPGDKEYFGYQIAVDANGKKTVQLTDCFIKEFMEAGENSFSGFKIYPALGYYPFDEKLLPLWKYAADKGLPVLTHCIRGTIFYRGRKKTGWNQHPVFEEFAGNDSNGGDIFKSLLLPQRRNEVFSWNFTHPLNYLCLLDETLLRKIVGGSADDKLKELFGYGGPDKRMDYDLSHLKICFGHFGGDDEWKRFFEKDRDNFSDKLLEFPDRGIDFLHEKDGDLSRSKPEQVWKGADWYSIICSLMLQYDNVYADISYILHDDADILPLLKQTLQHPKLKQRVLYGTDFYVVRNHKSDKQMLADMMKGLNETEFDQIARINPAGFI